MRRRDPYKPKDRIDKLADHALDALNRIKKKDLTKELRLKDINMAKRDLREMKMDNHRQA
jgi:hypothetical protein